MIQRSPRNRGFSLVEMLTVLAITAILMTLIVVPVFQTFNLTRNAQAFVEAQSRGRQIIERLSREISEAMVVRGTGAPVTTRLNGTNGINLPGNAVVVPLVDAGNPLEVALRNCKLDLVPPAKGDPQRGPGGGFINPNTGFEDPTLATPRGDVTLPVAPGRSVVRFWLGLRDPSSPYNNPYDGLLMARNGSRDNLVVLHRAEVEPFVYRAGLGTNGDTTVRWRPNRAFFEAEPVADLTIVDFENPRFYLADGLNRAGQPDAAKNQRVANWRNRSRVLTDTSRTDMIQVAYNPQNRQVLRDGLVPQIMPLLQFGYAIAAGEQAEGMGTVRPGEGAVNARMLGPDTFQTRLGHLGSVSVRHFAEGGNLTFADSTATGFGSDLTIIAERASPGFPRQTFFGSVYTSGIGAGYPFSSAALPLPTGTPAWVDDDLQRSAYAPFWVDPIAGKLITSFGIDEVGRNPLAGAPRQNLPTIPAGDPLAVNPATPFGPVDAGGAVLAGYSINGVFNRTQQDFPAWRGQLHRFVFLPVVPNEDGTLPPSFPHHIAATLTGFPGGGINSKVRIVPNSEIVYGPNQTPGPDYGQPVRYTRTNREPRINQYRINYANLTDPDYAALGFGSSQPVPYDPLNFQSAVIQPRFRAGYVQFCSDPNVPLPNTTPIRVFYKFQFNGSGTSTAGMPSDTYIVDYDSRQQIEVLLTVRNFAQSSAPNPQSITLKASAKLRNMAR